MEFVAAAGLFVGVIVITGGIQKNIFRALNLYKHFRIWWLRVTRGRTEQTESERRVITGKAWEDFCDSIKCAGAALVYPGSPMDGFNQAEGYRYLSRLVRYGFEQFIECNDPLAPRLVNLVDGLRDSPIKVGAENPDNQYLSATLDSREAYLLSGKRNDVRYMSFGIHAGTYGQGNGQETISSLDYSSLKHVRNGDEFAIQISSKPPERKDVDWLEMKGPEKNGPIQAALLVRQSFYDRLKEKPGTFQLKRISGPNEPSPFSAEQLVDALETSADLVVSTSLLFTQWAHRYQKEAFNRFVLHDPKEATKAGGDPQIIDYEGYWSLPKKENVLVIDTEVPVCQFWNFQLNNHWMETLDYRYFPVHLNKGSAIYASKDKTRVRLIIAHRNPAEVLSAEQLKRLGPFNWIDTAYHYQGHMLWRWVRATLPYDKLPVMQCRKTTIAELAGGSVVVHADKHSIDTMEASMV